MIVKSTACKKCNYYRGERLPNGKKPQSIWEVDKDAGTAECCNCHFVRPYIVRRKPAAGQTTEAQETAIDMLREQILAHDSMGQPGYEYKKFEATLLDFGTVSLVTEVGRVGDEGKLGEVLFRTYRHIFIGPAGGLKLANPAKYVTDKLGRTYKKFIHTPVRGRNAITHLTF